jgi:3-methyladenine DNA glycosylase AlkD
VIEKMHFKNLQDKSKKTVFDLCDELWQTGIVEEAIIAGIWSFKVHKHYLPEDIGLFDKWVKNNVTNWATCDNLCNHTVGSFLEMYPSEISVLKEWALSENRWVKRASAVSLILPARKGKFLNDIFEIAGILLTDRDDMVQKGYGWMLKEASKAHLKEVYDFVSENKSGMPRTAYRYAIEKMPPEMRKKAMEK